jgi:hypothetical protein
MVAKPEPSAMILPFGKHKGRTVADVLSSDPQYAEWMLGQAWFAERFAELHAALLTRGAASDDTPEHNLIQARFLDPLFQAAFVLSTGTKLDRYREAAVNVAIERMHDPAMMELDRKSNYASREALPKIDAEREERRRQILETTPIQAHFNARVLFEQRGVDVLLMLRFTAPAPYDSATEHWRFFLPELDVTDRHYLRVLQGCDWKIEIKPSLGDDFPTVMRQMERLRACVLVIDRFAAVVPLETVRAMFKANGRKLITVREIEAEIANARALIA